MGANRLTKTLRRRLMVYSREQPNRYDIEALQANIERVGLVIRVRWALVAALTVFSVIGAGLYAMVIPIPELAHNMVTPAITLVFVLGYNTFYWRTYRRLGNIAILNHAQLLFDALVVTVLVYYSGGSNSWFWAMYSLFILEAAFILPKRWHTWAIAGYCLAAVGAVIWGSYFGVLPQVEVPFIANSLHRNFTFVAVRYLWEVTVLCGTATVATLMTGALRRREAQLASATVIDDKTGLYDRAYFLRTLGSELARAERDGRAVYVMLADIDDFDRFNRTFGIDAGDRMLRIVAQAAADAIGQSSSGSHTGNILSRWGGEEFAALVTEDASGRPCAAEAAEALAEQLRLAVAGARLEGAGVTVSIGVACYPGAGVNADDLLTAADEALNRAAAEGGNRVSVARPAGDDSDEAL